MPIKDGREYRSFETLQLTDAESGGYVVEGYATTFDDQYALYADVSEVIERGSLDEADMSDVIFQLNHAGTPLARLRNGTLSITPDDHGLYIRADLSGSQKGRDLHEAIKNGLVDRMSWGFKVAQDGCVFDRSTNTIHVKRIDKVFDVSAVSIPANEGTEIHARSYIDGVIEAERQELAQREREMQDERWRVAAFLNVI